MTAVPTGDNHARWSVDEDGNPAWIDAEGLSWGIGAEELADKFWFLSHADDAYVAHAALVRCVRDADQLTQARTLAVLARQEARVRVVPLDAYYEHVAALLDVLPETPDDADDADVAHAALVRCVRSDTLLRRIRALDVEGATYADIGAAVTVILREAPDV